MRRSIFRARLIALVLAILAVRGNGQEYYTRVAAFGSQGEMPAPDISYPGMSSGTDIQVFPSGVQQSEISIAVNWCNDVNLLIGANAVGSFGYSQGYYFSENGGSDWFGDDQLPGLGYYTSDPAVAFDVYNVGNPNGYSNGYFNYLEFEGVSYRVRTRKTTDGGNSWLPAVSVPLTGDPDKNHITTDPTNGLFSNYIYTGYTDFLSFPGSPINISRSTNLGETFSTPVNVSLGVTSLFSQGVNLQVGPAGEVYAAWAVYDDWSDIDPNQWDEEAIGFARSMSGGAFWETPVRIREINGIRNRWTHKNPEGAYIRVNSFPVLAVDRSGGPYHGTIYLVYAAKGNGSDLADIHLIKSTDQGVSWSSAVRVNDDVTGNDQWFPWATVSPLGRLTIVFYDSRNDLAPPVNQMTEVWIAESTDGGQTFTNSRVSDVGFTPVPVPNTATGYMGDYIGIVSKDGVTVPAWADNRTGIYQAYVDIHNTYLADMQNVAAWSRSPFRAATAHGSGPKLVYAAGKWHRVFQVNEHVAYAQSADDGSTWTQSSLINGTSLGWLSNPSIFHHGEKMHVVFKNDDGTISYVRGTTGGVWDPPRTLYGVVGTITDIAADVDPVGIGHVVFTFLDSGPSARYTVAYGTFDTKITHPVLTYSRTLASSSASLGSPSVSVDPSNGTPHVAWQGNGEILYRYRIGSLWVPQVNLSATGGMSDLPRLMVIGSEVHLVWQEGTGGDSEIYYRQKSAGGSWSTAANLSSNQTASLDPCLVGPVNGNAMVVWADSLTGKSNLYYSSPASGISGLLGASAEQSRHPACGVRQVGAGSRVVSLCTDGALPLYEVVSGRKDFANQQMPLSPSRQLKKEEADGLIVFQNSPNPFNPETTISFSIPEDGDVRLQVFDIVGQQIGTLIDGHLRSGLHRARFDGSAQSSGLYFYRLEYRNETRVGRMMLLK